MNEIRYILGATSDGGKELCLNPGFTLCYINYVIIENDEEVRARLLAIPVLEDLLNLLVDCHRRYTPVGVATASLRRHSYLPENGIANWHGKQGHVLPFKTH